MKAIVEDLKSGEILTCDVPAPELQPGGILLQTHYSAISSGTERSKVEAGGKSLLGKALARPELARQVLDYARTNGIGAAYRKVQTRLDTLAPLGYSCSGIVMAVGEGLAGFQVGDRVACAGLTAGHSEVNFVPRNLIARVPERVSLPAASLTTLGAIALQGLRQSQAKLGESVAVIGAGLIGVLSIHLARAAGCRVLAIDRDARRAEQAARFGAQLTLLSEDADVVRRVNKFSRYGADVVLITAATRSAEPLKLATQIVRDRGRIVVVGDVLVEASRAVMYEKELTLLMSRSYGPGRYDPQYEESGCDYPIAYVRWTEQRNMEAFLDLLAADALDLSLLFEKPYALRDIESAYSAIRSSSVYTAIVEYPAASGQGDTPQPTALRVAARSRPPGDLRIGCIGAGSFARSIAFPALRAIPGVGLESVAASTGVSAESARRNYQFARTQTATELLSDGNVDVVLVLSRHDSHADYVSQALENRKPVYVEKPLAINRSQLLKVREACNKQLGSGVAPFVMVGFNRRFAPATRQIRDFFVPRCEPMAIHIRVNAGSLPPNHWTTLESQGGRVVGELCHFIDWARAVVTAPIRSVRAVGLHNGLRSQDDVAVILSFWDGSVANLLYLTNGDASVPKEYFEVFCEGAVAQLDDFHLLRLHRAGKARKVRCAHDKGHRTEFLETIQAIRDGQDAPIPFEQIVEVTEASLAILESIRSNSEIVLPLLAEDSSEMGRVTAAEERWRTQKG